MEGTIKRKGGGMVHIGFGGGNYLSQKPEVVRGGGIFLGKFLRHILYNVLHLNPGEIFVVFHK